MPAAHAASPVVIPGPAGDLEGLWADSATALAPAVICHPHPAHGGSMHSRVVHTLHGVLSGAGHPTLRFNFRGVGKSQGVYSGGDEEIDDLAAAARFARGRTGRRLIWAAGFSFGARIALRWAAQDRNVERIVALGLSVNVHAFDFLEAPPAPLLIVQGDRDPYGTVGAVQKLVARLRPHGPVDLRVVSQADHFFTGRISGLAGVLRSGLELPDREG